MALSPWILAARPKTLPAAVVPVLVGGFLAERMAGGAAWPLVCAALAACLCLQLATNLFNDAIDFAKGADTGERIGPQRVTQGGLLGPRAVMVAAGIFLLLACCFSLPLLLARGWPILAIGIPSLFLCFGYTGGPFPLAYLGLGELFVILFFGLVAVLGTHFVSCGQIGPGAWVAGLQVGALSTLLICINNLRDVEGDAQVGKRTLAVRFGVAFARWEILVLTLVPYVLGFFWWRWGVGGAGLLPLLVLPLGLFIVVGVFREEPSRRHNRFLALSALQLLVFALLWAVGLWMGTR